MPATSTATSTTTSTTTATTAVRGVLSALVLPAIVAVALASSHAPATAADRAAPAAVGTRNSWLCTDDLGSRFRFKVASGPTTVPPGTSWLVTSSYTDGHQLRVTASRGGLTITEESLTQVRVTTAVTLPPRTTFRLKPAYIVFRSSPATRLSLQPQGTAAGNTVDTFWRIGDTPCD